MVPLEGVKPLRKLSSKATLDVVIESQTLFDKLVEVTEDFVRVFVEQSLEFGHLFIIIEIFLVFSIKVFEHRQIVFEGGNQLFGSPFLSNSCSHL